MAFFVMGTAGEQDYLLVTRFESARDPAHRNRVIGAAGALKHLPGQFEIFTVLRQGSIHRGD